jgi:hypothetical protein
MASSCRLDSVLQDDDGRLTMLTRFVCLSTWVNRSWGTMWTTSQSVTSSLSSCWNYIVASGATTSQRSKVCIEPWIRRACLDQTLNYQSLKFSTLCLSILDLNLGPVRTSLAHQNKDNPGRDRPIISSTLESIFPFDPTSSSYHQIASVPNLLEEQKMKTSSSAVRSLKFLFFFL